MNTTCAFAAARLAMRSSRLALRASPAMARHARSYGTPAYQSYGLPTNTGPLPSRIETTEAPLPTVNETRPPKQVDPSATIEASTTFEKKTPTDAAAAATATPAAPTPAPAAPTKRPRPKLRARKAAMKLTPAAVEQLRLMLDDPEPKHLKVGVRNRGCSGLAYHLAWVDKPGPFDEEVAQDGVRVLIDSKALFSIIGSEMDWVEDKLSQKFVFKNPNIKEECGCGESFMV